MPIQVNVGEKKGGGGILGAIGSVLGAVAGVVAAPFTAGASLLPTIGTALGGAAAGSAIGGKVGGLADMAVDPIRGDKPGTPVGTESAMSRRAASITSSDPSRVLEESLSAIKSPGVPQDIRDQYSPLLQQAYAMSNKRKKTGEF